MFKPELWQSHDEYRTMVSKVSRRLLRNDPKYLFSSYKKERQMLFSLNLDLIADYIPAFYSHTGRPARHQAQILRSLILFTLLFNRAKARTSLTLWVTQVLPGSISLALLIGYPSLDDLPPLGSYYDFMDRFWLGTREHYSRSFLLPAGKNGKKPKKVIGTDGKLAEPEAPPPLLPKTSSATSRMDALLRKTLRLHSGGSFSSSPSSLPSSSASLTTLPLPSPAMTPHLSPMLPLSAGILLPARLPAPSGTPAAAIFPPLMPNGDGTATIKTGISATPSIRSAAGMTCSGSNFPSC